MNRSFLMVLIAMIIISFVLLLTFHKEDIKTVDTGKNSDTPKTVEISKIPKETPKVLEQNNRMIVNPEQIPYIYQPIPYIYQTPPQQQPPKILEQRQPSVEIKIQNKPSKPVLENIGFNLGRYDPSTNKAGDVLFVNKIGDHFENKIFLEFAQEVKSPGGPKILPHPTYFLPLGTKLFSPVFGKIENIRYQKDYNDYEIIIIPNDLQEWRVGFDHIIDLKVQVGQVVKPGDIVGSVAQRNSEAIPAELGWVELMIWKSEAGSPLAFCPFIFLNDSVKNDTEFKITQLTKDWENFIGKDVYLQEKWVSPGCIKETAKG